LATQDYFSKSRLFKARKVARYVELYGLARTVAKIRAQYHMRAGLEFEGTRWNNSACPDIADRERSIGIIGCGAFSYSVIAYYLARQRRSFLRGAMDISRARARSLVARYKGAYATTDFHEIVGDPAISLVYIASNHASHAEYAVKCIEGGKHVHIEKPHVVSQDQLSRLQAAMRAHPAAKVFLGFNRPRSPLFRRLKELLAAESGPVMINWFVAGHQIEDDHWYFSPEEGGRILGNLCHWTDLSLETVAPEGRWPLSVTTVAPADSRSDFVTTIAFGDGSMAAITFSAKGHTFEGVREIVNIHRGNLLAEIKDFKSLDFALGEKRKTIRGWHRDHGHAENVVASLHASSNNTPQSAGERQHVIDTARLFLAVKQSHEEGRAIALTFQDGAVN